ncbi:AAA family ATPase [Haloferax chudinovii]|uniref:ORC1-type DNA replication protein n=1 Tax=Haloferax chudinovii TaxID=1109010 RepID=A0ABD5XNU3_9EURY
MGGLFEDVEDEIYREKRVLKEEYQPDEILERDSEVEEYKHALTDTLFGRSPDNIFLFGKAGVGKTAVTNFVLSELQREALRRDTADEIHVTKVNCNNQSVYSTVRHLVNSLRPEDTASFPKKGPSTADAFEELYAQMERLGGTHLFVLDEIDHLSNPDPLLYEFPRARANGHINEAKVGLIGISNNYTFRNTLSAKVKSTLMEHEISFSTYDAGELQTILTDRAQRAFVDGACVDSAISACAAFAAKDDGSARQAIDLLREAADTAQKDGATTVTAEHVERVREQVNRGQLRDKIDDQTMHAQLVLESVARQQLADDESVRTKRVQQRYEAVADAWGHDHLTSLKSIQNHLDDLHMLGFLIRTDENKGQTGGRSYRWEVDMNLETVIEAREEIELNAQPPE